ncbi:hypothetical protein Moror_635 [Moniliophthora roreri MCA 2997]|uniref:Uncharacterized protein n=1 Tax=Moniliophthora roreri (strain MCA 2997) TaxID=1381753 RepID=V2WT17_MONRO|nr:hypothetical protein Moror_635 [Moniliophthora roreri MCA 2997]
MSSATSAAEAYADFLSVRRVILDSISSVAVMYFAYGFYVLLFGTCIRIMHNRQSEDDRPNYSLYLSLTIILFVLSTLFVAGYTIDQGTRSVIYFTAIKTGDYDRLDKYLSNDLGKTLVFTIHQLITVFMNLTADTMLIHRCYVIWGSRKRVGLPLAVASTALNALGLTGCIINAIGTSNTTLEWKWALYLVARRISFVYGIVNVIVNSMITLLTAGRIWWIHRQVRARGVHSSDKLINSISRIILESGIIYPIFVIGATIAVNVPPSERFRFDFYPLAALSAGIAPTLILVRAKLGKNVETFQPMVSDLHFTSRTTRGGESTSRHQAYSLQPFSTVPSEIEEGVVAGK